MLYSLCYLISYSKKYRKQKKIHKRIKMLIRIIVTCQHLRRHCIWSCVAIFRRKILVTLRNRRTDRTAQIWTQHGITNISVKKKL